MDTKTPLPENQVTYEATPIYVNSSAAQTLAMNNQVSAKSKHIELKHYYAKAALSSGIIVLRDVAFKENPANLLTKVLSLPILKYLCEIIKLCDQAHNNN